ncbi:hypothetical protein BJX66DRAFT_326394 [Aspergillus keveii]|uniref:RanBD1 domain-containing protein n=1 Tax=Aspergillus keveii TaxID=714993 RepID=A0ABR4G1P6_9EURO
MQSTPDDKPQRATAAQLANRRIKDIRKRPRAGSPSGSSPSASFGGPFSSLDPNTVSAPAGSQPATNGFSFGQSQSFPPASASPKPPTQNGGSQFAFGSGSGSTAFNFSGSFGASASTPPSNPFASMNTGATQQPASNSFTGFKGNMFNIPSTGSQSPAQQPLPSGGLFGATSQPSSTGVGIFGNTATSGPSSQSGTITPPNGTMFGQSNAAAPASNMFGQSGAEKPNPFAQTTAFGNDSMQTSPDAKAAAQKPFSAGSSGFGISTNFGGSGAGTLFGGTSSAPSQTPSKPLFGAKPAEQPAPTSTSLFSSSTTQPSFSASTTAPINTAPSTTATASPSLFSASTPKPVATPQNPFQSSSLFGAPVQPKEANAAQPTPSQPSINFSSSTTGPSLFSKSASQASNQPSTLFQAPATGKQEKPKAAAANPFSSLFVPKPAAAEKPTTEQKPLPSSSLFAPKPAPVGETKANEPSNSPSSSAPQSSPFSLSTPQTSSPAFTPATTSQSPFNMNGVKPATSISSGQILSAPSQTLDKLKPAKMPSGIGSKTEEDVEMANRVRVLNESFRRFDALVVHYLRVRETIGSPLEVVAGMKRKTMDNGDTTTNTQPSKKIKPFGSTESASAAGSSTLSKTATPSTSTASPSATPTGSKRKAAPAKRPSGGSTTAKSGETTGAESPKKIEAPSFKPATPEPAKPSLFSTTPTSSPPKPLFPTPAATKETSSSGLTPSQAPPVFKPTFNAATSSTPPANPFVLNPSGGKDATQASAPLAIPKFGSGNVNFFEQFKAQSDKEAEKEKAKRKDEDFDSDEDDEAEWERKDAENQRKKQEAILAQQSKRPKYIPGQGFSFEEDNSTDGEKSDTSAASSMASNSVFDTKSTSFGRSSNIFGHLSATPSESGENEHDDANDTEEASESGDDAARESSFAPTEDLEASNTDSKSNGVAGSSAPESSDEGDFTKALKMSKQTDSSDKIADATIDQGSSSRSLFDRVQYDQEGKPKRQDDDGKTVSSLLGSSKYASSFNSGGSTPNPFASLSQAQSNKTEQSASSKPAPTNVFGSSSIAANPFGAPLSGASTPSIFGSSTTKPASDNTWKLNTPIKFATDSPSTTESTTKSISDSAPASGSSQPFSALFGPAAAGSKSGSGAQQPLGFSFGGPSQPSSSFLTPSALTSATPSRASTPGMASDTGAEESADGDAAEALPQVDLARGGAGEENEDVLFESKSRALKLMTEGNKGWDTKGMGITRILKDRTTSRARILIRADPSGNVVLNAALQKEITYKAQGTSVQFLVPKADGPPEMWAVRLKAGMAEQLAAAMEGSKS